MPESSHVTTIDPAVGDTVQVRRPDGTHAMGIVADDFGPVDLAAESLGRDWAPPHRWAVALDDGRLVFADDGDLLAPPATNPSGR